MKKAPITILIALILSVSSLFSQVQVDKFTGDVSYGLPLLTIPNFRGPSVSTSISYRSDIKVDQTASEVGLGWNINAGGSVERIVNGVPDDWNTVFVPDMQAASFQNHLGALYLHTPSTNTVLDFDYTRYKMDTLNDTLKYYYPNYDTYFVTGAGMAGKIMPANYDYASVVIDTTTVNRWFYNSYWYDNGVDPPYLRKDSASIGIKEIETYSIDGDNPFNFKTHFQYEHNLYDEVDSKAFPWDESPINSSTTILIPEDTAIFNNYPTYNGAGYNNEDYTITANRNRTRTSNYIEYFTNEEIYNDSASNFIEYDTLFNRSVEADFPQKGIGAYRITDPNGYTYHYSLPVYAHYNSSGNYSLDKDYNVKILEGGSMDITDSTNGYIVENEFTHEILEIKQVKKYAIRWLLTAITGPDFEDSNSNGIVDEADKGYWVNYNYELWTETFPDRFPYYGSRYSFGAGIEENIKSKFLAEADSMKMTGKMLFYSTTAEQVYYLNQIQTPSHTGIFCRDLRYDEQSQPFINTESISSTVINNAVDSAYITENIGDAILTSIHPPAQFSHTLLIEPTGYSSSFDAIDVEFRLYNCFLVNEFTITIYDGDNVSAPVLLARENDDNLGDYPGSEGGTYNFTATSGKVLVKFDIDTVLYDTYHSTWTNMTYDVNWSTRWDNALPGWPEGRQKTLPSLKLSQLFLFDNNDLDSLPTISAIDTLLNDKLWDYSNVNRSVFYNSDWYETNKTKIDSLALQSIKLDQDYSLAKEYHNNRFVIVTPTTISSTPIEVENNKYTDTSNISMSGKLTLNKVIYYGLNRTQTQPSHLFDYSATDTTYNPNYNHLMQDYWGNYKSDADSNLLRGYVTANSAARIAAWSLRTVTSPLGGTTEIIYEADEYEQVLSEEFGGTLRGPIKTFALKNVNAVKDGSGNLGADWTFEIENQESEFWNVKDNLPYGAAIKTVIPAVWIDPKITGYEYHEYFYDDLFNFGGVLAYGSGTFTTTPNKISALARCYETNFYDTTTVFSNFIFSTDFDSLAYSGGGLVEFQYPIGEKIKGGGTRVKELKVSNGTDIYTVAYSYDEGTATIEAGDFSKQRKKLGREDGIGSGLGPKIPYDYGLTSLSYNPFGMSPQVGYGKVTIENKGQTSTGQGKSIFNFQVSNEGKTYFEPYTTIMDTTWTKIGSSCGGSPVPYIDGTRTNKRHAIEIIDDFTSIWGKIKEQKLQDINGITISKKIYEYETSTKGADVSTVNYLIDEVTGCDDTLTYLSCIKRSYPTYLKKVITYSNGRKSESEILERDPFTGDPLATKNTSVNGTISNEDIVLAYTQTSAPDYTVMGAKSVDPSYQNFLNATYSSKTKKASEGLTTADFSSYGKSFWKDSVTTRYYDASTDKYTTLYDQVNWFDYTKYAWTGALGNYGIFDSTAFTDITSPPTSSSDWRFITEITLMDEEQNVLEQKGFNDRFSASKLGYDNRFTYTSGSNTNYVSFTATGFETQTEVESGTIYYEGEVLSQSNTQITSDGNVYPHTGNYMVNISAANSTGPIYKVSYDASNELQSLQRGRTYTASVWVHKNSPLDTKLNIDIEGYSQSSSYSVSDTMSIANTNAIQIGDWIQLTVNIDVPSDFTCPTAGDGIEVYVDKSTYTPAWIDDMMFHSRVTGSGMNVYDQRTGRVMATLSDNNFATKYVYNDAGQVIEVWKEVLGDTWGKWVKVESRDFNFQRAME